MNFLSYSVCITVANTSHLNFQNKNVHAIQHAVYFPFGPRCFAFFFFPPSVIGIEIWSCTLAKHTDFCSSFGFYYNYVYISYVTLGKSLDVSVLLWSGDHPYKSHISTLDYHLRYLTCDMYIYIMDTTEISYNISEELIRWNAVHVP